MIDRGLFRLFACCIPVKGASRSTICDLQRRSYYLIPNALFEMLVDFRDNTVEEIKTIYGKDYSPIIDDYYKFLISKDLGFWCEEPGAFPDLRLEWEAPSIVTNAIIDVDDYSGHDFLGIFSQLEGLGCWAVQVRVYCDWSLDHIERELLAPTAVGRLRSIELLLKFSPELESSLGDVLARYQRITSVIIHASPECRVVTIQGIRVLFRKEFIDSDRHCGQVHPSYFAPNLDFFCEANKFNSCLNRKVGIDVRGEIKNCPSCDRSFGSIRDTEIRTIVRSEGFQRLWHINKDLVDVCKDCEFRYIC